VLVGEDQLVVRIENDKAFGNRGGVGLVFECDILGLDPLEIRRLAYLEPIIFGWKRLNAGIS
jgi:hypothetical protein